MKYVMLLEYHLQLYIIMKTIKVMGLDEFEFQDIIFDVLKSNL